MASTTETPLRAELFGETPPVPDSPDINEVIQKLREELEQKYEEKIQELKVIIDALKGGPPNLNANPMNDVIAKFEKPEKLKPIDLKDLKKPEEFDGTKDFHLWYERFKDLLGNRNRDWKVVLELVEQYANGTDKISHDDFAYEIGAKLGEATYWEQWNLGNQYAHQLRSYLGSYSKGLFYDQVSKADTEDVFELFRVTIKRGRNRNPYRMVAMKAEVLSPPKAKDAKDLEKVLTEWKFKYAEVQRYDQKFELTDDTRKTLLMKILPRDYVKIMREQFDRHETYDGLEHQLFTEMATRQMEDEHFGKEKGLHAIAEYPYGDHCQAQNGDEWDPWIGAIAPKRDRDDADDDDGRNVKPREDKGNGKGKGKQSFRGPRVPGPCWTCGGPHLQWECPNKGKGKGPTPSAWSSWRPGTFPGPSPTQWRAWLPRQSAKSFGKGSKGKEKGGKGDAVGKGMGAVWWNYPALGSLGYDEGFHEDRCEHNHAQWQTAQNHLRPICVLTKPAIKLQNKFSELAINGDEGEDFPDLVSAVETKIVRIKMPKWLHQQNHTAAARKTKSTKPHINVSKANHAAAAAAAAPAAAQTPKFHLHATRQWSGLRSNYVAGCKFVHCKEATCKMKNSEKSGPSDDFLLKKSNEKQGGMLPNLLRSCFDGKVDTFEILLWPPKISEHLTIQHIIFTNQMMMWMMLMI